MTKFLSFPFFFSLEEKQRNDKSNKYLDNKIHDVCHNTGKLLDTWNLDVSDISDRSTHSPIQRSYLVHGPVVQIF